MTFKKIFFSAFCLTFCFLTRQSYSMEEKICFKDNLEKFKSLEKKTTQVIKKQIKEIVFDTKISIKKENSKLDETILEQVSPKKALSYLKKFLNNENNFDIKITRKEYKEIENIDSYDNKTKTTIWAEIDNWEEMDTPTALQKILENTSSENLKFSTLPSYGRGIIYDLYMPETLCIFTNLSTKEIRRGSVQELLPEFLDKILTHEKPDYWKLKFKRKTEFEENFEIQESYIYKNISTTQATLLLAGLVSKINKLKNYNY